MSALFEGSDLIHAYTRRQALADGVLIDVTTTAKGVGFCIPVAVTAALWSQYVRVPHGVEGQDEAGRLWVIRSRAEGDKNIVPENYGERKGSQHFAGNDEEETWLGFLYWFQLFTRPTLRQIAQR